MKECKWCDKDRVSDSELELEDLMDQNFKRFNRPDGLPLGNKSNKRFHLWKCLDCNVFWETRPLYEETMYGGEPGEWIKVTEEYVKEHYPGVLD